MPNSIQEHKGIKIRAERIRSLHDKFGIATNSQVYEGARAAARRLLTAHSNDAVKCKDLDVISMWSDDQCRQCMNVRGGNLYRRFIELVCYFFVELDSSSEADDDKLRRYTHFIWSDHPILISEPSSSSEIDGASVFPFIEQTTLNLPDCSADQFYNASETGISAIFSGLDILRDVYSNEAGVRSTIFASLRRGLNQVIALNGTSGSGRTILIDRLTVDAIREGYIVYRCDTDRIDPNTLFSRLAYLKAKSSAPVLIIFDDCYRMLARGISLASIIEMELNSLPGSPTSIVLVDNWNIRRETDFVKLSISGKAKTFFSSVELSDSEIGDLLDKIISAEREGLIKEIKCTLPKVERVKLLASRRDRLAIIALVKLRYGKNVDEVMKDEFESIQSDVLQDIYKDVVILDGIGIGMPNHFARRRLISGSVERGSSKALEALFAMRRDGFHVRHTALISPLLKAIYPDAADRTLALTGIIKRLDLRSGLDREFWILLVSSSGISRRILRLFSGQRNLMQEFLLDMREMEADFVEAGLGAGLLGLLGSIYKDVLGQLEDAFVFFQRSYELDPHNPFVLRQLSWCTLKLGKLSEAEEYAREAVSKWPDDAQTLSEAALILSWCSKAGFDEANSLYARAFSLSPGDRDIERQWERYKEAASVARFIVGSEVSDATLDALKAPSFVWRVRRHASRQFSRALFRELSGSLRRESIDLERVEESIDLAKGNADQQISGLVQANIARTEYERWYHFGDTLDLAQIRKRFEKAVKQCPKDPFIRLWFGTYLKEAAMDYALAQREYESARALALSSKMEYVAEHPMILNNIALLIIDGVYRQKRRPEELKQAYNLLRKAISRMEETKSEFRWPLSTMESLRQQAVEFGVVLPLEE